MNVIFATERFGNVYRGEVLDAKTYETVLRTSNNYASELIAKIAAQRDWKAKAEKETA